VRSPPKNEGMTPADFDKLEKKGPLRVYTARMGYKGEDAVDITRSSGTVGQIFAPTWTLLKPFLEKRTADVLTDADWERYTALYLEEMRASYRAYRGKWDAILARPQATFLCFCVNEKQCHRRILSCEILTKLGAVYLGERQGALRL